MGETLVAAFSPRTAVLIAVSELVQHSYRRSRRDENRVPPERSAFQIEQVARKHAFVAWVDVENGIVADRELESAEGQHAGKYGGTSPQAPPYPGTIEARAVTLTELANVAHRTADR